MTDGSTVLDLGAVTRHEAGVNEVTFAGVTGLAEGDFLFT